MSNTISPIETRAQPVSVSTYNDVTRTVEVDIAVAGALVKRYAYPDGHYIEELAVTPQAIKLDRLQAGASLLNAHQAYSMDDRLGIVVPGSVRVAGGKLMAMVKLSRSPGGERLAQDLRDGIGFAVSVGYAVLETVRIEGVDGALPTVRATLWEPMEVSAVPIPADENARTRSIERNPTMAPEESTELETRQAEPNAPPIVNSQIAAERERIRTIQFAARAAGLGEDFVTRHVDANTSSAAVRHLALDMMVARQEETGTFPHVSTRGLDGRGQGRDYAGELQSIFIGRGDARDGAEIVRSHAESNGIDTRSMNDVHLSRLAFSRQGARGWFAGSGQSRAGMTGLHTTSDFTFIVSQALQATALEIFAKTPTPLKTFSRKKNARDFRQQSFYRTSDAPDLLPVNEAGEIKSGTFSEEAHGLKIATYGRMIATSFQLAVNDNLGMAAEVIQSFSSKGIDLEGDKLFSLLAENAFAGATLSDGYPTFHDFHGNVAAVGNDIAIGSIEEASIALRTQKGVGGTRSSVTPHTLLVGPRMEVRARQFVASFAAQRQDDVNPFTYLSVVVEDRYEGLGWWLLGDPASRPLFLHGYLDGHGEGPVVDSEEGFEVLGTKYRAVMHFGCTIHDYRAAFFNPGVAE